jgi:aminoglycoside/choline kinase family phosphotransferase
MYGAAFDALTVMATSVDATGLPPYDESRLVAEMELMPTWFLQRHLGRTIECEEWDVIESAFRVLLDAAAQQPHCFVHRDFHSRNLLLPVAPETSVGIIDFQDAVYGPITYDLVSLLRDCYVVWPEERVQRWVDAFRQRLVDAGRIDCDASRFRRWFDLMGLQRHLKVLGIFCRLWYRDGKPAYLADLPRVWAYVRDVGSRYPDVAPLVRLLQSHIGARDLVQPAS